MQVTPAAVLSYTMGIAASLGVFSAILLAMGYSPPVALASIFSGTFGTLNSTAETMIRAPPLLLSALAFLIAFKGRFFNIGVEGQLYVGALSAYLASAQLGSLPGSLSIFLVGLAAIGGGAAWLAVPLFMRIKFNVNEIFPTLVMNFIATFLVSWLTTGSLKDPNAVNPQTPPTPPSTWLAVLVPGTRLHLGVVIAPLIAIGVFVLLYKTVLGYEIRAAGLSPLAARHGGVNVARSIVSVGLLSGGLAGLAGMIEIAGTNHLLAQGFSPGYGYQGIGVAVLGGFHPIGAVFTAILYAILSIGGESMQRGAGVPIEMIYVLQATIVISVLIGQKWFSGRKWGTSG